MIAIVMKDRSSIPTGVLAACAKKNVWIVGANNREDCFRLGAVELEEVHLIGVPLDDFAAKYLIARLRTGKREIFQY